ncbi:unnamed protein product [Vitrella brassicaformis CCMP3155]|uniref:Uncharacterized protein n=1 Tax=Vitrella brassicaformis (strain CCMP3155) TaxID=1169540 RepID=A0A0G4GVU7_VITBC|nr:unnamed protein product [Vitrella brassicaformis CCMP3155]|eukprot:CEM34800.1 unnamed protein product [Vitrella brassicaformis CCMP3155]
MFVASESRTGLHLLTLLCCLVVIGLVRYALSAEGRKVLVKVLKWLDELWPRVLVFCGLEWILGDLLTLKTPEEASQTAARLREEIDHIQVELGVPQEGQALVGEGLVSKLEPTAGGTRVFMREEGGTEEFKIVVPNATSHFHELANVEAVCDGFKWVGRKVAQQQSLDGQKSGEPFCLFNAMVDRLGPHEVAALSGDFTDLLGVEVSALFAACKTLDLATNITKQIKKRIDQLLRDQHIDGWLTYEHDDNTNNTTCGGSSGLLASLPLIITSADVRLATADKTLYLSRPEAIRQYSLYSHQLGDRMHLTRNANRRQDELAGWQVTVHTQQTVPARYRDRFNPADPPCRHQDFDYGSFRESVVERMAWLSLPRVSGQDCCPSSAEYHRICALMAQQPPLWDGCRTIDYGIYRTYRLVILCGEEDGDDFAACIKMDKLSYGSASISIHTTEAPQQGVSGPAAFLGQFTSPTTRWTTLCGYCRTSDRRANALVRWTHEGRENPCM